MIILRGLETSAFHQDGVTGTEFTLLPETTLSFQPTNKKTDQNI